MSLFDLVLRLEENDELHQGRLLILLGAFAGRTGKGKIGGLTKLAKLDFLLRYPVYLEQALKAMVPERKNVDISEYERHSVESRMVRFRYGPWDFRYRRLLNELAAKGLVELEIKGRTVNIGLTERGLGVAQELAASRSFFDIAERTEVLKTYFDIPGTKLMQFIYRTFPELINLKYGQSIEADSL